MQTFSVTIKRVTDETASNIMQLKAAGVYRPLPDAQHTLTIQATDRAAAFNKAQFDKTLAFSGQGLQVWIDGTRQLGNW
ncbi:hypothetical protein [Hymenobacter lapidiphilus]|uniref:Uncharacterized protein n=1 Tax=Hymenobacter lapidiphilus TaxID=2608003 RepID=A0A7Y7PRY4_9BACT|nr:hypothetical protein [Hymenobacter lapidiphilus]NVO32936.1 hypothetical protein [Hymenobacter lapidiphilus]